eukprot:TRINITY_DN4174_c0_g3_i2.p1 TRINITY_DN4174_c0_g3~~TRINITY_DN4174_c0_g3_i2.p1  ORF type:complete len:337 (+),score=43.49 TRINITY_DN4174_c0_g3_i2:270-1280(+)
MLLNTALAVDSLQQPHLPEHLQGQVAAEGGPASVVAAHPGVEPLSSELPFVPSLSQRQNRGEASSAFLFEPLVHGRSRIQLKEAPTPQKDVFVSWRYDNFGGQPVYHKTEVRCEGGHCEATEGSAFLNSPVTGSSSSPSSSTTSGSSSSMPTGSTSGSSSSRHRQSDLSRGCCGDIFGDLDEIRHIVATGLGNFLQNSVSVSAKPHTLRSGMEASRDGSMRQYGYSSVNGHEEAVQRDTVCHDGVCVTRTQIMRPPGSYVNPTIVETGDGRGMSSGSEQTQQVNLRPQISRRGQPQKLETASHPRQPSPSEPYHRHPELPIVGVKEASMIDEGYLY